MSDGVGIFILAEIMKVILRLEHPILIKLVKSLNLIKNNNLKLFQLKFPVTMTLFILSLTVNFVTKNTFSTLI